MATCFVFLKYSDDEGHLSLVLDDQGEILSPLIKRDLDEIKALKEKNRIVLVLSTEQASLYQLELPKLSDKKAREVIPFALEEKLADSVERLHFAFDRKHYKDGRYLVSVLNKPLLKEQLLPLEAAHLNFESITLDWFALEPEEACILDDCVLVNDAHKFCGALSFEFAKPYLDAMSEEQKLYSFPSNTTAISSQKTAELLDMDSLVWIAKRLQKNAYINLLQGDFKPGKLEQNVKRWYWAAGGMSLLWLLSVLVINGLQLQRFNAENRALDEKIAKIYRVFFPGAQQVISPKFRIEQLLKTQQNDNERTFWALLNKLSRALEAKEAEIQRIQFQNKALQVTLYSKNFEALEGLQTFLKNESVRVRQSQAASEDGKVNATLELSL